MSHEFESPLARTALASGLVTPEQLQQAMTIAWEAEKLPPPTRGERAAVADHVLGQWLVQLGYLNVWQVEQLRQGRTRFSLGPYRVIDSLGQGGMGHLFKVEHRLLGRIEAIKILPRSRTTPATIAEFRKEIRLQAQLDHPHLVRVHYADHDGDLHYFVTEYVPGIDLQKLVRGVGPLPYPAAAWILQQVAEGLDYAHRRGLVHRDIKPGNVLVTPAGTTKLIDLGLAWYLKEEVPTAQQGDRQKISGTVDYLAPEIIGAPGTILPTSDLYSLGCTLYYAVTGKVAFPGGSPADKMQRHIHDLPLSPCELQPDLPSELVHFMLQMLAKDPRQRPASAAAIAEQLQNWVRHEAKQQVAIAVQWIERQRTPSLVRPVACDTRRDDTGSLARGDGELVSAFAGNTGNSDSRSRSSAETLSYRILQTVDSCQRCRQAGLLISALAVLWGLTYFLRFWWRAD